MVLQIGWRGLPVDGVDAYVHVWSRKRDMLYFFKGRPTQTDYAVFYV